MAKVKILMPYRAPAITAERFGHWDMVIPYQVDGMGPYEVRLPEEDFTPEKGEEKVREEARKQIRLYGRELEVS